MRRRGFSLVELLVAAAVLAIILAILGGFLVSNARISTRQMSSAEANMTLQQSLFRLTEIVSQAHYIYPAWLEISASSKTGSKTFKTGRDVLALLVPVGSNYCRPSNPSERYCGFIFSIEPRTPYEALLGEDAGVTGNVLVEWTADDIDWQSNELPPTIWPSVQAGVLADSIASGEEGSSLSAPANLHLSTTQSLFDEDAGFLVQEGTSVANPKALIGSVEPRLIVRYKAKPTIEVSREAYAFSRAIPRGDQPILP